jgi:5-(carboxyamino)imidazole ribonucleotide synthase
MRVDAPVAADLEAFGYPVVQKLRRGGYDGRAVALFRGPQDLGRLLPGPSMLETLVDLDRELAVMVARGLDGDVRAYPVVEMEAHPTANLLDLLVAPARIPPEVAEAARDLACRTVEALDGVGVFGVELFLAKDGALTVNEVAPRPHNSGHYTIEACLTSQFEQHLRAVTGLPLGSTDLVMPAAMINLLGEPGHSGPPLVEGLSETMAIPGVAVHIYGKAETRPFRKMGHVTVLDPDVNEARAKALRVRDLLRIKAEV